MRNGIRTGVLLSACLAVLPIYAGGGGDIGSALKRIFEDREFSPKSLGPSRWVDEGAGYTVAEEGKELVRFDTASGRRDVLVSEKQLTPDGGKPLKIEDYEWSADRTKLLIFTNTARVWRLNTRGDYWVLELASGKLTQLGRKFEASSLLFAKFSPDGTRAAYVYKHNIYLEDLKSGRVKPLTRDGSETIINGTSDWVNEEELFLRDCFRWSPDGKKIAYWQFDTSGVGIFTLINDTDETYPKLTRYPYPKAGTKNSAVRTGVVDTSSGKTKWLKAEGDARENYVSLLEWAGNSKELLLHRLNRLQNTLDVLMADARTGAVSLVLREKDDAFVDVNTIQRIGLKWLDSGKSFLWLSERDGWHHAYRVSRDGKTVQLLTPGVFDVTGITGADEEGGWLYFTASPDNATQRYLFRAKLDGSGKPERVTPAEAPGTHSYRMAPGGKWAWHTWSAFDKVPTTELVKLPGHETLREMVDNSQLQQRLEPILKRPVEFFRLDIGGGVALDGWMLRPREFDPSRKYPLLVHVYGEPAGTTVNDAWGGNRALFHRALAEAGYLVVSFDNRGTPAPRGRAWRKAEYGSVGWLAGQDQAAAVRALAKQRPYVDASRVAIWGWSGGGSSTLHAMFRFPDVFQVGMAVAAVPDKRLYDTIYQERYMGLPGPNDKGYHDGSPISFAEGLRGRLLIVHGSGDDNVHFQGAERLVNRLVELGKPFDMEIYPNRSHAISEGKGTTFHIYSLLARYLTEHLQAGGR